MAGAPNPVSEPGTQTPPVSGQTPAGGATTTPSTWYSDFKDPELKGYVELNRWDGPEAAARSARDAQKLVGAPKEELLRIPTDLSKATPEQLDAVYNRLGRPEKPEDYGFKSPDGQDAFAKAIAPTLHKIGVSKSGAAELEQVFNNFITQHNEQTDQQRASDTDREWQALHREWPGEVYPEREALAKRGVEKLGLTYEEVLALETEVFGRDGKPGNARLVRAFAKIGEQFKQGSQGKDSFVIGNSNSLFGMTPASARELLSQKNRDLEWGAKVLNNPGGPEAQERDRLIALGAQG